MCFLYSASINVQLRENSWTLWIGYVYDYTDQTWNWADGSTSAFENWYPGQPDTGVSIHGNYTQ